MQALIAFWSHALCAAAFLGLLIWRVGAIRQPDQRLLLAGFAVTACWAWLSAILPGDPLTRLCRNGAQSRLDRPAPQPVGDAATSASTASGWSMARSPRCSASSSSSTLAALSSCRRRALADTATLLRITAAAGALVLVHNLYGQAAPASRSNIRLAMLALSLTWSYDLNLYTIAYLDAA